MTKLGVDSAVVRWYVLVLTCLIYTINIADRYVVSTVLEPIRDGAAAERHGGRISYWRAARVCST